nr:hypothetical protein [Tanacetum cinerariifolium]
MGEGSAQSTNTQHTPTFDMPPSKLKKTQKPRQPKRKTTKIPQPSQSIDIVTDEAVRKEGVTGWKWTCFQDELDNVVEEEDGGWICFLSGNNSSGTKKYRGSNSSDGGNTKDGVKIIGGVIGFGGGIGDAVVQRTSMTRKRKVVIVKVSTLFSITMALDFLGSLRIFLSKGLLLEIGYRGGSGG